MKRRLGNSLILLVLLVSFGTPLNLVQADTSPNVFINEILSKLRVLPEPT